MSHVFRGRRCTLFSARAGGAAFDRPDGERIAFQHELTPVTRRNVRWLGRQQRKALIPIRSGILSTDNWPLPDPADQVFVQSAAAAVPGSFSFNWVSRILRIAGAERKVVRRLFRRHGIRQLHNRVTAH
jgi:hypothetical protein